MSCVVQYGTACCLAHRNAQSQAQATLVPFTIIVPMCFLTSTTVSFNLLICTNAASHPHSDAPMCVAKVDASSLKSRASLGQTDIVQSCFFTFGSMVKHHGLPPFFWGLRQ